MYVKAELSFGLANGAVFEDKLPTSAAVPAHHTACLKGRSVCRTNKGQGFSLEATTLSKIEWFLVIQAIHNPQNKYNL